MDRIDDNSNGSSPHQLIRGIQLTHHSQLVSGPVSPRLCPRVTRVKARVQVRVHNVPVSQTVSTRAPVSRLLSPAPRARRLASQRLLLDLSVLLNVILSVSDVGSRRKYL
mgnify:CR=1 FL=1